MKNPGATILKGTTASIAPAFATASASLAVAALLAASLTFTAAAADAPTVSIRYHELSAVDGPAIRLGDIARIIAGDEKIVAQLETLEVAKAAGFGLTRVIDTDALFARHLQPFADRGGAEGRGGPGGRYSIETDRKSVRVTTRSAVLPPESLAKVVEGFLASQPRRKGETWKWELVRAPAVIKVPVVPHTLELAFAGQRRKGKVELLLAVRHESRTIRTLPITVNLRVEEPVLVALKPIARDEVLSDANVALQMRETTLLNEMALADPGRLKGRLARATIQPGRVITPRLVALAPAVRRGQEAKVVYRSGDVNITAGAVCRQDGVPGQIITAKSLVTQRLMRVRVTENGNLEPVPGG